MAHLQRLLNIMAMFNTGKGVPELYAGWDPEYTGSPAEYGEQRGAAALTKDEIIQAARHQYDVWCCGYNWLQSNRDSGGDLKTYIEDTVLKHYSDNKIAVDKVIVATHSMGGLVSRALTELHGYDKVLGVVHGVLPATGAPAIYHHVRCGYEGASQAILGSNAGEVTSVDDNSPVALELTPSFDHDNGKPWLFIPAASGEIAIDPKGDPYTTIYTNPVWYGLVPEINSRYLNLSGENTKGTARFLFNRLIVHVEKFHHDITKKYHPTTYAHYAADNRRHSWQTIHWKGDPALLDKPSPWYATGYKDNGNGSYQMTGLWVSQDTALELVPGAGGAGDGTVAETSGVAPGASGVKASFRHGNLGKGSHNVAEGYEHQDSYLDTRAEWATFYSIVKIAQDAVE